MAEVGEVRLEKHPEGGESVWVLVRTQDRGPSPTTHTEWLCVESNWVGYLGRRMAVLKDEVQRVGFVPHTSADPREALALVIAQYVSRFTAAVDQLSNVHLKDERETDG